MLRVRSLSTTAPLRLLAPRRSLFLQRTLRANTATTTVQSTPSRPPPPPPVTPRTGTTNDKSDSTSEVLTPEQQTKMLRRVYALCIGIFGFLFLDYWNSAIAAGGVLYTAEEVKQLHEQFSHVSHTGNVESLRSDLLALTEMHARHHDELKREIRDVRDLLSASGIARPAASVDSIQRGSPSLAHVGDGWRETIERKLGLGGDSDSGRKTGTAGVDDATAKYRGVPVDRAPAPALTTA